MHVFPAQVPSGEFPRGEVVAVRLARKVAPLFGVRWAASPFGRTWVCDFASLTLAEIARGAPLPTREQQVHLDAEQLEQPWQWAGRAVWTSNRTSTPGALANATLNRYGPDTKAAVVLAAANRLLVEATEAVAGVCRELASAGVDRQVRLAVWAGLILEIYRGQPALVVAAVQARAVQRSLTGRWGAHLSARGLGAEGARCEITPAYGGAVTDAGRFASSEHQPVSLDLVDATLPLLHLTDSPVGASSAGTPLGSDREADIASAWCRRLLGLGRPGRGIVWIEEDHGDRRVHACIRVGATVAPFVAEVLGSADVPAAELMPPLTHSPELTAQDVRARLLAVHVAANYLRYRDDVLQTRPQLRDLTRDRVEAAAALAEQHLGPEDPVTVLLDAYRHYLRVWDALRQGPADVGALEAAVGDVLATLKRVTAAWRADRLDPGAASYLLEISAVALDHASTVLGQPAALEKALPRLWQDCLSSRGMGGLRDVTAEITDFSPAQTFHLHNYAAYLAGRGGRAQLRRAVAIEEAVSLVRDQVAAAEPAGYIAKHTAARNAHEVAAWSATRLAACTPPSSSAARRAAQDTAFRHAVAVLRDPSTTRLLVGARDGLAAVLAARAVLPAVADELESAADPADVLQDDDRAVVTALLSSALQQLSRAPRLIQDALAQQLNALKPRLAHLDRPDLVPAGVGAL